MTAVGNQRVYQSGQETIGNRSENPNIFASHKRIMKQERARLIQSRPLLYCLLTLKSKFSSRRQQCP